MRKLKYTVPIYKTLYFVMIGLIMTGCATSMHGKDVGIISGTAGSQAGESLTTGIDQAEKENTSPADSTNKVQIYPGTGKFVRESSQTLPGENSGDGVVLNFESADLREVVKVIVGDLLQKTYLVDPTVQGSINLITSNPIQRSDLLPTLETLLRMNGAAIVHEAGIYKVVPMANAVRGSITPQLGHGSTALGTEGFTVLLAPLKFIAASEMAKILEPFSSESASVRIDESRNLVILSGTRREISHFQETIDMFDVNWLEGMSVGLYPLQSVDAKTAVEELDVIFGKENQTPIAGLVKLVAIERLNAVMAISSQSSYLKYVELWIDRFDRSAGASGSTRLFIYLVQNGEAEKLADLLNDVFGGAGGAGVSATPQKLAPGLKPVEVTSTAKRSAIAGKPSLAKNSSNKGTNKGANKGSNKGSNNAGAEQEIRVIADEDNNALLILASPSDYEKIEAAIRQLDVIPRQVMIDVTIAEVKLAGDFKYGLEWAFTHSNNLKNNVQLDVGAPGIETLVPGFSYVRGTAEGLDRAFNLLANDSRVNVISSPHVMVTDNQTASINVGDQVPTTSQTQSISGSGLGIISSIQYIDTGVILSVTPRTNAGGLVTMEIDQEVSAAAVTTTSGIDSPTISRRKMKTTVVVKSGETVMLGGLITETKSKASSGIPGLSRIPIIGGLFGAQSIDTNRIELVILITPRLISNSRQARDVTEEFRNKMRALAELLDEEGF